MELALVAVPLEEPDCALEPLGTLPAEADPVDEAEPVEEAEPLVAVPLPELEDPRTRSRQLREVRRVPSRHLPQIEPWSAMPSSSSCCVQFFFMHARAEFWKSVLVQMHGFVLETGLTARQVGREEKDGHRLAVGIEGLSGTLQDTWGDLGSAGGDGSTAGGRGSLGLDTGSEESSKDNKVGVEQHGLGQKRANTPLLYRHNPWEDQT